MIINSNEKMGLRYRESFTPVTGEGSKDSTLTRCVQIYDANYASLSLSLSPFQNEPSSSTCSRVKYDGARALNNRPRQRIVSNYRKVSGPAVPLQICTRCRRRSCSAKPQDRIRKTSRREKEERETSKKHLIWIIPVYRIL